MHLTLTQYVNASPEVVWRELADLGNHTAWMSDALEIAYRSEQREGVGTSIDCLTRVGPFKTTDVMTVTEWIDGARIGVERSGLVGGSGAFELHADPDGARVVWDEYIRLPWIPFAGPFGEVFARPLLSRIFRKDLRSFAAYCESR